MASSTASTKPSTNGHGHPPDKQPQGVLEDLINAINNLSGDRSFQALKKLVEDNNDLRARNQQLEVEVNEYDIAQRKTFDTITKINDESSKAESELRQKERELKETKAREAKVRQDMAQGQKTVDNLNKELEANREKITETMKSSNAKSDQIKQLQDSVKAANAKQVELDDLQKKYATTSQELIALQELAFPLRKIDSNSALDTIRKQLDSFFDGAYQLADKFFGQMELSEDVFQDKSWLALTEDKRLSGIPLSPTNSQPARKMRAAAVLRLIALAAVEHLFQPVYLTEEGGELRDTLDVVYFLDPPRSHQVRSLLLNIDTKGHAANGQKRAEATVRDVFRSVRSLLVSSDGSAVDKQGEFRRGLQKWCDDTRDAWMGLQPLEIKFMVLFEVGKKSFRPGDWRRIPDQPTQPTQGGAPADGLVAEDIVAQLWPAFFASRKDGLTHRFKSGYVLVKPQVLAARREAASARSSSDSSHRRGGDRLAGFTHGSNNSTENFESFLSQGS
ncbi:hypothetical protein VMCG_03273 [Cytospora schulzeri]|uniref:MEI5 protein n=1 Tax=Cytospora schulzeri TaxID=448051 RepID=A0A423WYF0_9PEZI|nr:hypothetical protein VMCG_03273 [Valsa malicola]